jgi:hypothetical protein
MNTHQPSSSDPSPTPTRAVPARRFRRDLVLAVLLFLGGAACGAAVASHMLMREVHQAIHDPHAMSAHITARLATMLDLTEEQSGLVREIILRRHNALIDIRRDIQPRLEAELSILEEEIAGVLNQTQRVEWHAHAAAMRAQWLPPIPAERKPAGE